MKNKIILIFALFLVLTPLVYAIIWSNETSTDLIIESVNPSCVSTAFPSTTGWWETIDGEYSFSGSSFDDCYRPTVDFGSNGCCPENYVCDTETNKCVLSSAQLCSQYTQAQCPLYSSAVAIRDIEEAKGKGEGYCDTVIPYGGVDCYKSIECECYWDETGGPEGTGQCDSQDVTVDSCSSDEELCQYHTTVNEKCDDTGFIDTTWTITPLPETTTCKGGSSSIKCLSTALLPLFGTIAIIIVIVLIVLYYILRNRKKVRKKKGY